MISAVIPIFNEADVVRELYRRLVAVLENQGRPFEIVFVDDGSSDGSLEILKEIAAADRRVVAVELAKNYGQTASLAAGIDLARGDIIVTMDGDLQHQPEEIPKLLAKLEEGYDIVSGWRERRTDNVMVRQIPSRCANMLMRRLTGVHVRDFGSTFKAYRSVILKRLELFGELHRFIPVLAHRIGARITEIAIEVPPRETGKSNYGLMRVFGVLEDIVFLEFYSNYLTKPIRAFGRLFFIFFGTGFSIATILMLLWGAGVIGAVYERPALLLFAVFTMIVGVQFLILGVLAELLTRIYLHTSQSKIYFVRQIHQAS